MLGGRRGFSLKWAVRTVKVKGACFGQGVRESVRAC